MYHCLLAILAKFGYERRNQECTFAAVAYLIQEKKLDLDEKWIAAMRTEHEGENELVSLREKFQYSASTRMEPDRIIALIKQADEFAGTVRGLLK